MEIKCFVDMDGVIADFNKSMNKLLMNNKNYASLERDLETIKLIILSLFTEKSYENYVNQIYDHVEEHEHINHFISYLELSGITSDKFKVYKQLSQEKKDIRSSLITKGFFENIEPTIDAFELMDGVIKYDPCPTILTAPVGHDYNQRERDCRQEKYQWMAKHFKNYIFNFICVHDKS
jgi:hypothetical protein